MNSWTCNLIYINQITLLCGEIQGPRRVAVKYQFVVITLYIGNVLSDSFFGELASDRLCQVCDLWDGSFFRKKWLSKGLTSYFQKISIQEAYRALWSQSIQELWKCLKAMWWLQCKMYTGVVGFSNSWLPWKSCENSPFGDSNISIPFQILEMKRAE